MKKFIVGLLCGIVLCFCTAAVASNSIQAVLFPSKITIHNGTQIKELNSSNGTVVLNYKNQTYIPLRAFSEAMGSLVNYNVATKSNGNLNQIEIFSQSTLAGLNIKSNDGYVTIGNMVVEDKDTGSTRVKVGTIKVNKDLSGKQIDLEAVGEDGTVRGVSEFFYIDNENIEKPKAGDIKSFQTELSFGGPAKSITFRVSVHDIVYKQTNNDLDFGYPVVTKPFYGYMAPTFFNDDHNHDKAIIPYKFSLLNTSGDTLVLDNVPLNFFVYKTKLDGTDKKLIYQHSLPPLQGKLAPREGFNINIPWYQNDKNGPVLPGKYLVTLEIPKQIQYLNERTGIKQPWDVDLQYGTNFSATKD
jgi:hypothetical protein